MFLGSNGNFLFKENQNVLFSAFIVEQVSEGLELFLFGRVRKVSFFEFCGEEGVPLWRMEICSGVKGDGLF